MDTKRNAIPDLAAVRKRIGVSLEEIAVSTKISIRYLRAIEDRDIRKLPGAVYTRSYIRQYARAIDWNEDALLLQFGIPDVREVASPAEARPRLPTPVRRLIGAIFPMPLAR
jgi:hypothetical protein